MNANNADKLVLPYLSSSPFIGGSISVALFKYTVRLWL